MSTTPVDEIISILQPKMDKLAVILVNGVVLFNNFEEEALISLVQYVQIIIPHLEPGSYVRQDLFVILRLSINVFILGILNIPDEDITPLFTIVYEKCASECDVLYPSPPKNLEEIAQTVIFSMAREDGPEPVAWVPESHTSNEIMFYSIKSLLILTGENNGPSPAAVSLRPFLNENLLGFIYLFDIPVADARGGAYSSSITILVDYSTRAFLYEVTPRIEVLCQRIAGQLAVAWQNVTECVSLLQALRESLGTIPLRIHTMNEDIKEEMIKSIRDLRSVL